MEVPLRHHWDGVSGLEIFSHENVLRYRVLSSRGICCFLLLWRWPFYISLWGMLKYIRAHIVYLNVCKCWSINIRFTHLVLHDRFHSLLTQVGNLTLIFIQFHSILGCLLNAFIIPASPVAPSHQIHRPMDIRPDMPGQT
jgi:hypothetical protein